MAKIFTARVQELKLLPMCLRYLSVDGEEGPKGLLSFSRLVVSENDLIEVKP